jgi:ABC-type polysaccharide/polyol phosphate export permease
MWQGDYSYLISNLVMKDFRVRYRNMSLGVLWSLLNPLVTMAVLTFVFTRVFPNNSVKAPFALFVLCGIVPYNFFALAWSAATISVVDNSSLIKRVSMPRPIIPIAVVLANCLHLIVQIALLLALVLCFGAGPNRYWLWLPVVWGLEIVFVCGLGLVSAALDVYIRDTRYIVESINTMMFWLVPIFYPFEMISQRYREVYQLNPVAALVMALRNILLDGHPPAPSLLYKLCASSFAMLGIGIFVFHKLKRHFYNYL